MFILHPKALAKADMQAVEAYNRGINMLFVQNVGQLSNEVVFYSMHPTMAYVLKDGTIHINGVKVSFGTKPRFITGDMPLKTKVSYFGQNKAISNVPTYRRVVLKEVYPKIDAVLTADGRGIVELQFIVRPGGDPSRIRVETDGDVKVEDDGIYVAKDGEALAKISSLKAYQGAEEVKVRPVLAKSTLKFVVGEYDRRHTLVIDPVITAILASSDPDKAEALAVDDSGVYVAGYTMNSSDFAPSRTFFGTTGGYRDAFISKLDLGLTTHIATAILTSSGDDVARAIAVDGGSVYVAGYTWSSSDFAPSRTVFGTTGETDAFVSKLDLSLSSHIATAILASSRSDIAHALAVDGSGVYVAGETNNSSDFGPSRTFFGTTGGTDAFVSKLDLGLTTHIATAILTSSSGDVALALAIDGSGVYVSGYTNHSSDFGPGRTFFGTTGGTDAFVSKLDLDLTTHIATAILTSSNSDMAYALVVDGSGVYVAGETSNSSDFGPSRIFFGTTGGTDAFVSKLDLGLTTHIATAILTSSWSETAYAIDKDGSYVYVAGLTNHPSDFAPSRTILGTTGSSEVFVSKMDMDLSSHIATAILASSSGDVAYAVTSYGGSVYVAGGTTSFSDFGPSRTVFGNPGTPDSGDAFVSVFPLTLDISEKTVETGTSQVLLSDGALTVTLKVPAYVGYDLYSPDGRLVKRVSLGYLPAGRYRFNLKVRRGTYILKVRVGGKVKVMKGAF